MTGAELARREGGPTRQAPARASCPPSGWGAACARELAGGACCGAGAARGRPRLSALRIARSCSRDNFSSAIARRAHQPMRLLRRLGLRPGPGPGVVRAAGNSPGRSSPDRMGNARRRARFKVQCAGLPQRGGCCCSSSPCLARREQFQHPQLKHRSLQSHAGTLCREHHLAEGKAKPIICSIRSRADATLWSQTTSSRTRGYNRPAPRSSTAQHRGHWRRAWAIAADSARGREADA